MMAETAAFDNIQQLTGMAESLADFVQRAVVEGTAAHEVEREVWKRVLAIGRQTTGHFFQMQGDGDVGETDSNFDFSTIGQETHEQANSSGSLLPDG